MPIVIVIATAVFFLWFVLFYNEEPRTGKGGYRGDMSASGTWENTHMTKCCWYLSSFETTVICPSCHGEAEWETVQVKEDRVFWKITFMSNKVWRRKLFLRHRVGNGWGKPEELTDWFWKEYIGGY